jgi:hypothetical protein
MYIPNFPYFVHFVTSTSFGVVQTKSPDKQVAGCALSLCDMVLSGIYVVMVLF